MALFEDYSQQYVWEWFLCAINQQIPEMSIQTFEYLFHLAGMDDEWSWYTINFVGDE